MAEYEIKDTRVVASAPGVFVRELTFAPGESTPWHRHSEVSDRCYGLTGALTAERENAAPMVLRPGESCEIAQGTRHRLVNASGGDARVLIVQSGGRYDFIRD